MTQHLSAEPTFSKLIRCKPSKVFDLKHVKVTPGATASQRILLKRHQVGNQGWEEPDKAGNSTAKGVCKAFIRSSRDSNTLAAHQFPGTTVTFNTTHSSAIKGSQGFDDCVAWNQPSGSEGKPPNGSKIDFMLECARRILAPLTLCWLFCYSTNDLIPWEKAFCLHRVLFSWILDELVDI